ncbi:50S ribosomal protein L23 [Candidatus Pacearchaeota archaeon]|nr:50S ribosomal protein L23 [Candidatus Pacearchaeota archaeon]
MNLKPIVTEKAVMKIESENVLMFRAEMKSTKEEIKKEVEEVFEVKVSSVRTQLRDNKKIAYVKLNKKYPAMDLATKLGLM